MNTRLRLVFLARLLALLALGSSGPSPHLRAQDPTDTKIRLMAEALRGRDEGDLAAAQSALDQLAKLAPRDPAVQRLRTEIEAQALARRAALAREEEAQRAAEAEARREAEAAARLAAGTASRIRAEQTPMVQSEPLPASRQMVEVRIPDTPGIEQEAEALAREEATRLASLMTETQEQLAAARVMIGERRIEAALVTIDAALARLPLNPLTQALVAELKRVKASAYVEQAQQLIARGEIEGARIALAEHDEIVGTDPRRGRVELSIAQAGEGPASATPAVSSAVRERPSREHVRAQLIDEVSEAWRRPGIYQPRMPEPDRAAAAAPLLRKLNEITLPNVHWTRAPIGEVVASLAAMSEQYDPSAGEPKGVNMVLIDPTSKNPAVTITLRNASLKRVLDFVTEAVGYQYEVAADAVVVRPGGETSALDTAFFPITRATVLRMTGGVAAGNTGANPYSSAGASNAPDAGAAAAEATAMRAFLQQAGVSFTIDGSSLAYDGSAIIVTQTARNLDRIRNILARYNDVRQVEIEAKFMEVQEGALEELGVQWNVTRRGIPQRDPVTGAPVFDANGRQVFIPQEIYGTAGVNRTLAGAFSGSVNGGSIDITGTSTRQPDGTVVSTPSVSVPFLAPVLPGALSVGSGASPLASISGFVGEFDVNAVVRALSQKQGTDLLSSPKVTVLSGNPASITVAQEMRYPQSYGQIESQVGTGNASGGGSAGVAITAGTPQEFTSRNVGVELKVTPTVEEDDYSISLDLNPKVTEFDGFVEYGGPSVAISGGTTVTVPPGFFQPIFSVRDISTRVTIWDGATLIMGGLTREEVKKVDDKIPVLGSIPLVGRLFRTKGESAQKRNLLIFVTANLVSPGGSPKKQTLPSTPANSIFQNPGMMTPAGVERRAER